MNLFESIRTAFGSITTNKMRTALTMLGIIIGVAAVVTLSALGKGIESTINGSIQDLGSNMLIIAPNQPDDAIAPVQLTTADVDAISDPFDVPLLTAVAPVLSGNFRVTFGEESANLAVTGTNRDYESIRNLELAQGSFLTAADLDERARVAVLGSGVYEELFAEDEYPLGKSINIDGTRFRVVGVLESMGGIMNDDEPAYASYCQECGKCVAACPQQIPIPERLKETARQLEGPMTTFLKWGTKAFLAMQRRAASRAARRRRGKG